MGNCFTEPLPESFQ